MLVTGRQASRMLGLGRETTNRVLAAGLAGPAVVTTSSHLYDADRVAALVDRPVVHEETPLPPACAHGVLVARIDPRTGSPEGPWRVSPGSQAVLAVLLGEYGNVPLVTTVGGFVLSGADVTGYHGHPSDRRHLVLRTEQPADWYETFDDHILWTPPGHPLLFWRCRHARPIGRRHEEPWPPKRPARPATPAVPPGAAG